jgi:hypothetical protein
MSYSRMQLTSTRGVTSVNRTRNGTCVNRVVFELWKEQSMY